MAADLRERVARALGGPQTWPEWLPEADAVIRELGLTQAEPVAWRVPGGQWEDGQPYQSDIDLLEKAKLKPEYAYAAPQPQASAEDVELVGVAIKEHAARYPGCETENAWQRIRASLVVGK